MASQWIASKVLGLSEIKEEQLTGREDIAHALQCGGRMPQWGWRGFRVGVVVYQRGDGMSAHWRGIHRGGEILGRTVVRF